MIIKKRKDAEKIVYKNALLADDGETLWSKYLKGEISYSEYFNKYIKNKGHENDKEYRKYLIEEKRRKGESPEKCMWTKEELEDIYAYDKQNLSPMQIGKIHDPPVSYATILRWLDIYNIEKKILFADDGETLSFKLTKGEINSIEYQNERVKNKGHKNVKEYQKYLIEEKRKKGESPKNCMWSRNELENLYSYDKQNLTAVQIGKIHDPQVNHATILNWIDVFGIEKKTESEAHSGKNNGWWQGGISDNLYTIEFTYEVREQVCEYWYRNCVLCGFPEKNHGIKLSVHHVDYNKDQNGTSIEWKLVSLCNNCHNVTNNNRNYYEHLFTNFIKIRKTLEEFDWEIDYRSIGMIDEIEDDKIEYIRETLEKFDNNIHWRSLGI